MQTGLFSELKEIPTDSIFKTDVSASNLAVGKSWYTYNGQTMIFSPTPGKTLVENVAMENMQKSNYSHITKAPQ